MKKLKVLLIITIAFVITGCSSNKKQKTGALESTSSIAINYLDNYTINNKEFGTKTTVTVNKEKRIIETNALPNHKTGEFPNPGNPNTISAQNIKYELPLNPVFTGQPRRSREPGVAVNGVKFEPETAERFICETGQHYRIEAFQDLVDLGLDFNHAHVQPTGAYHYHGVPTELIKTLDNGEDLILVGFAKDGFKIYYSKSNKYKPSYQLAKDPRTGDVCSYSNPKTTINKELNNTSPDGTFVSDWEYVEGLGDLDPCNGINIDGEYIYLVTDVYPYVGRCLMGEFAEPKRKGPPPGHRPHEHPAGSTHSH